MKEWNKEQLKELFDDAESFLIKRLGELKPDLCERDREEILSKELLVYVDGTRRPKGINGEDGLFYKMLVSLSNRQGFSNFIGKDTLKESKDILFEYDANKTYKEYKDNENLLIKRLKKVSGKKLIVGKGHVGSQYADGVISIAEFVKRFETIEEFDSFVSSFSKDYAALPALLSMEIKGYGFALACDALKESGYKQYGKPDVHLKEIFAGIGLIDEKNDLKTFRMIQKIAEAANVEPAVVDKVFWIVGSGKYNRYNDEYKGDGIIEVDRQRDEFIKHVNEDR